MMGAVITTPTKDIKVSLESRKEIDDYVKLFEKTFPKDRIKLN